MSASRADTVRLTTALVLAGLMLATGTGPASSQSADPVSMAPESTLAPPMPDAAGVLAAERGGLGPALWVGTPLALVRRLLAELPVAISSPAQRRLTVRLLLSAAEPPAGDPGGYGLVGLRVAKLAALGAASEVVALVAATPGAFGDEAMARAWVEAQLLQSPETLECQEVTGLARGFGGPVWPRLALACPFATKDATGAAPVAVVSVTPGAAELALAQAAGVAVPAAAVAGIKEPARLAAVARSMATDPDLRVVAAERAAAAGALAEADLAAAYAAVRFAPAALARPLTSSEKGPRARALLYQAAVGETQAAVRAELIRRALELLDPGQRTGTVAAVPLALLGRLPVDETTGWLAPLAVRAFLATGRPDAVAPWLAVPHTAEELTALARLWPLAQLAEGGPVRLGAVPGQGLGPWLETMARDANAARRARAAGVLALFQAVGEPVSDEAWTRVGDQGSAGAVVMPSPALWQMLQSATTGHRVGETVLAALGMLGEGGPQALPPVVLAQILAGLRDAGLTAEARALAREAVAALVD